MSFEQKMNQPDVWAQKALDHMRRDHLDPTPENFAVFYAYCANTDANLKMAVDALMAKFGSVTQRHCTEIYQNYLSLEAERQVLQDTNASVEAELKRLMSVLDQNSSDTTHYNQTLTNFSGALQSAPSLDAIRAAVTKVAQETRIMADQNQRLQTQLAKSTEQLAEVRFNLDQVKKDSLIDPLTEIGNRKSFDNELARITSEAIESGDDLSLLMIDIDHFKKFNDSYGHLVGDQVLRLVAKTLVENLKGRDIIARYGGEEFVILLPSTRVQDAERVANQLRGVLATKQIQRKKTGENLGIVTISIGVTEYYAHEDLEGFVARADAALYEAKQTGRNRATTKVLTEKEVATLPLQKETEKTATSETADNLSI